MSIKDDFATYVDGNKLMTPNPQPQPPVGKGSDNGPMYTSEYFIMLKKTGNLTPQDQTDFDTRMGSCVDSNGLLNRAPNDTDQEEPDDFYGATNGMAEMGNTALPRKMLGAIFRYFGCMNNNSPGTWTANSFMARQPQIIAAMAAAAFPSLEDPLHYLIRLAFLPFFLYSAIILALSCIGTDIGNTDARRLAWHLGNNVSKVSLLNKLGYKIFMNRLLKDYPNGMKDVASIYYQPKNTNPYAKYWVD
jgi:hypothetical protein